MRSTIRPEIFEDYPHIRRVNDLAFGQQNESLLIERLRERPEYINELSLVADRDGIIVGHILFFPVMIENNKSQFKSLSLAPMSVIPGLQKKGIGSELVTSGLERARKLGYKSVIVLGHEKYYPRFGFVPASKWSIVSPWNVPDEAFMAIELEVGGLNGVSGTVRFPEEFDEAI